MPRFNTILIIILTLVASFTSSSCQKKTDNSSQQPRDKNKIQVFVSILPQMSIVKSIGGNHVQVESLVRANSSPHDYEPTPRQLSRVAESNVFFSINMPFEAQLILKIKAQNSALKIFDMSENAARRIFSGDTDHSESSHQHQTVDPHVWLGTAQLETMATTTARRLSELYPQYASDFSANLGKYLTQLHTVSDSLHMALDEYQGKAFYVFHPAFGYFADSFGLKQVAVEMEGKSPSSKQILSVIKQAKNENVKIIFVQKQFDPNTAQAIAKSIDGIVVAIDPLEEDVLQNLQHIGSEVLQSFKDK